jgi:branched-chain amino acid transport system substrate-binding protein
MLLARAIKRAGSTGVSEVRNAAANHHFQSPQGPVWVDPDNNHCFLTPRLARSTTDGQFDIFWEAEAPQKPDPYLSALDATPSVRPRDINGLSSLHQQRIRRMN